MESHEPAPGTRAMHSAVAHEESRQRACVAQVGCVGCALIAARNSAAPGSWLGALSNAHGRCCARWPDHSCDPSACSCQAGTRSGVCCGVWCVDSNGCDTARGMSCGEG
eukprot:scaffold85313_cov67-Phaeocystis_antarctica.AAC.7